MKRFFAAGLILIASLGLQACITKVVTVPVKMAYGTTKAVVKGTGAVVGAVIPDSDQADDDKK
jgi:hypothetical protein